MSGFIGGGLDVASAAYKAYNNQYTLNRELYKGHRITGSNPNPNKTMTQTRSQSLKEKETKFGSPSFASGIYKQSETGTNAMVPTLVRKGKRLQQSGTKKVKVSPLLKKQITAALEPKAIHGKYSQYLYNGILSTTLVDRQRVFDLKSFLPGTSAIGDQNPAYEFSPEYFLDVMSKLWAGKTNGTLAAQQVTAMDSASASNMYKWQSLKLKIVSSSANYSFKNVGKADLTLSLNLCEPKKAGAYNWAYTQSGTDPILSSNFATVRSYTYTAPVLGTSEDFYTSSTVSSGEAVPPPVLDWYLTNFQEGSTDDYDKSVDVQAGGLTQLGAYPNMVRAFRNRWNCTQTKVIIKPGQEYDYNISGPSNYMLNFGKHLKPSAAADGAAVFNNLQPYMRYVLFTMHTDVRNEELIAAPNTLGNKAARWIGGPLTVTVKRECHLAMPDQVGFRNNAIIAVGGPVMLGLRRPYMIREHAPVTAVALTALYGPAEVDTGGATELV